MPAKRLKTIVFIFSLAAASCIHPWRKFESYKRPAPPDYSKPEAWAALPGKKDSADAIPLHSGLKDGQADAPVDVFFIHPTSFSGKRNWNARMDDKLVNRQTDKGTMRNQASVFNGSCKIYAPRYRQATLASFVDTANGKKAIDFAYQDVKAAFQYYLDHYNNGRPFIIASHSQGTWHAIRLIHEYIDNNEALRKKLVAAYLIGGPAQVNEFKNIPMCDSAGQTGCYMGWRTFMWDKYPNKKDMKQNTICVNPLTWKRDESYVPKEKNLGSLPFSFNRIDKGICDAQCHGRILWVHKPAARGYIQLGGNYHVDDYNLFYMNIRENVALRVKNYLAREKH
jgi:hypothetical protein